MDERQRTARALVAAAVWLVVAAAVLGYFGVAGFRGGPLVCIAVLAGPAAVAAWLGTRPDAPSRGYVAMTAVLAGVVLTLVLVANAPPSQARLRGLADRIGMAGPVVSRQTSGRSTCTPHCPRLTVTARAAAHADVAIGEMVSRLRAAGVKLDQRPTADPEALLIGATPVTGKVGRIRVMARVEPAQSRVVLLLISTRH